jgi:hypothetical protein
MQQVVKRAEEASMCRFALTVLAGALTLLPAGADEVKSGPPAGKDLPGPLQSFNVTGDKAGKFHCLICRYGLSPSVLILARGGPPDEGPFASLLKKLDAASQKYADYRLGSAAIFISEARDAELDNLCKQLKELAEKMELKQLVLAVISTAPEQKDFAPAQAALKEYTLSPDADLTVLLFHRHKVVANYAFARDKLTDKDVDAIVAQAIKMVPVKKK